MRDISNLCKVLEPATQWLDATDGRLHTIGDLVEGGKVEEAADLASELFAEGFVDIRPMSVLLYAAFVDRGVGILSSLFEAVTLALRANHDAIGPKEKKQSVFDRRLGWLFDRIVLQLEYHERGKTDQFTAWTSVANERLDLVAAGASNLKTLLVAERYETATRSIIRLHAWLASRAEAANDAAEKTSTVDVRVPVDLPPPKSPTIMPKDDESKVTLAVSHKFAELCQKLGAFEALIAKGRYDRAAVIAADVQQLVEQFDPRTYFPELFANFAALMSENIDTLSGHMDQRGSPAWTALDQFYRVDLKSYVDR